MVDVNPDLTEAEVQGLLDEADTSEDGKVDLEEFLHLMARQLQGDDDDLAEFREQFEALDIDGDGYLNAEDLVEADVGISEEDAEKMVESADIDGNGLITLDEFVKETLRLG